MTDEGRVIRFPTWRRAMEGAPGVRELSETEVDEPILPRPADPMGGWRPVSTEPPEVHGLDRPVWHEGASVRGDVLVRFRADLLGVKPPVWRRLECHGSLTLDRMHPVFAAAFGWERDSEYLFRDVVRESGVTRMGSVFGNPFNRARALMETDVRLDRVLSAPRERLRYRYGKRGGFELTIIAEDVMPVPPGDTPAARVLAGRRNDPPRTFFSGGMYELAVRGRVPDQIATTFDLHLPEGFDPAAFDLDLTDRRVRAAAED